MLDTVKREGAAVPEAQRDARTRLLDAATEEVIAQGTAVTVTVRAVARRAGLSHQAPAHHFGSRRGLLTALAALEIRRMRVHQEAALAVLESAPAVERLRAIGVAYVTFAHEHQAMFTLATSGDMPDGRDVDLLTEQAHLWELLEACVRAAQAEGWRADQPLEDVCLMCWALVHGTAGAAASGLLGLQFPGLKIADAAAKVVHLL